MTKVWLVVEMGDVDQSDTVVGAFGSEASADAEREKRMTRVDGLNPWDTCYVEMFEVQP